MNAHCRLAKTLTSAGIARGYAEFGASAIICSAVQQTVYGVVEFTTVQMRRTGH
jgi:hypothetical protein